MGPIRRQPAIVRGPESRVDPRIRRFLTLAVLLGLLLLTALAALR